MPPTLSAGLAEDRRHDPAVVRVLQYEYHSTHVREVQHRPGIGLHRGHGPGVPGARAIHTHLAISRGDADPGRGTVSPMMQRIARSLRNQHGVTLIELLVALAVFALFILMIDAVFSSARTNARKTEIAADVQQNARVAADRILRELHETNINLVLVNNTIPGASQVAFKSARLAEDPSIFCLYTRINAGLGYDARCFAAPGPIAAGPPYASPEPIAPHGTYTPLWQRSISYCTAGPAGGPYDLLRVVSDLSTPDAALAMPACSGDTVASMIESFDVSKAGSVVTVTLKANCKLGPGRGCETVQGRDIPAQEVLLPGQSLTRN